jgi:hypothetical protein
MAAARELFIVYGVLEAFVFSMLELLLRLVVPKL